MKNIIVLMICCVTTLTFAQNENIIRSFDTLVETSNSWTEYRVIKKANLKSFKEELIITADSLNSQIGKLQNSIDGFKNEIDQLKQNNKDLNEELTAFKNAKDEINFLGLKTSKANYQIIVWSIIIVLFLVLAFFFIKYRNRNIVTQELKENLASTTKEFEDYKHRAIEKQQKLGRDLLDAQKAAQSRNNKK